MKRIFLFALVLFVGLANVAYGDANGRSGADPDNCGKPKQALDPEGLCAKPGETGSGRYGFTPSGPDALEITSCYSDKDCPSGFSCSKKGQAIEGICLKKRL